MARVFKQTYTKPLPDGSEVITLRGKLYARYKNRQENTVRALLSRDGKRIIIEAKRWSITYRDADGIVRKEKGFTDKKAAEQKAAELERKAELGRIGIVDKYEEHTKRPLREHLDDFKTALLYRGNTEEYATLTYNRAKQVINSCGFVFISDISSHKVSCYLRDRRGDDLSMESSNHYLRAIKNFLNWMVKDRRTGENPVSHLSLLNSKLDKKRLRRALDVVDFIHLLTVTMGQPKRYGLNGPQRAMVYRLAAETGLRANEIRKLMSFVHRFQKPNSECFRNLREESQGRVVTAPCRHPGTTGTLHSR